MENYLPIALLSIVFLFAATFFLFFFMLWKNSHVRQRRTIRKRLLYLSAGGNHGVEKLNLYRKKALKGAGPLDKFIFNLPRSSKIDRLLLRSGLPINFSGFILLLSGCAIAGAAAGFLLLSGSAALGLGTLGATLPYSYLKLKERSFMNRFSEQLPEGIDLLARALRSGHALTSGLGMVAEEMDDPIKSEFAEVVDEIKLGLSLKEALDNLCERIPNTDLKFFAVAVLLQKETGGNLTEILEKISQLVRERIQFKQHVKTLTAEGRLSARILLLLPIAMFTYIYFANYEYISLLWTQKEGYYMLAGGIVMMTLGAITIRKITMIEV